MVGRLCTKHVDGKLHVGYMYMHYVTFFRLFNYSRLPYQLTMKEYYLEKSISEFHIHVQCSRKPDFIFLSHN